MYLRGYVSAVGNIVVTVKMNPMILTYVNHASTSNCSRNEASEFDRTTSF